MRSQGDGDGHPLVAMPLAEPSLPPPHCGAQSVQLKFSRACHPLSFEVVVVREGVREGGEEVGRGWVAWGGKGVCVWREEGVGGGG